MCGIRWMRFGKSWKFIGLGLVVCLLCLSQYQLRHATPQSSPKPSLPLFSPPHLRNSTSLPLQESPSPEINFAILLQISPVDPNNRIKRLSSIDQGWARWNNSTASKIDLYAPQIPFSFHHFHNIQTFPIKGPNPFHKMVESFLKILHNQFALRYDWLLFGNDHTFLIPQNLRCYLKSLDHTKLIYAGNKLHITFQGKALYFGSGGAGAILSRPALFSIMSVWTVLHPEMVLEILQQRFSIFFSEENLKKMPIDRGNLTLDIRKGQLQDSQLFYRLLNWTLERKSQPGRPDFLPRKAEIIFSDQISFFFTFSSRSSLSFSFHDSRSTAKRTSSSSVLHQFCTCKTVWDHDNPGIILAGCLQEVFDIQLRPAKSLISSPAGLELCNVYGLVRTAVKDFDPWYLEMKSRDRSSPLATGIPSDVISFHYISQIESQLLFQLLSSNCTEPAAGRTDVQQLDPNGLLERWPSTSEHLGHYSRKIRSESEAALIHSLVCSHMQIRRGCP